MRFLAGGGEGIKAIFNNQLSSKQATHLFFPSDSHPVHFKALFAQERGGESWEVREETAGSQGADAGGQAGG